MLESDHDAFMVELRELERLLKQHPVRKPCPSSLLGRIDSFTRHFESHMGAHFKAEEKAVFPFLQRHAPHLKDTIQSLIAEHDGIRRTLIAWKRSFRKAKAHAKPRANEIPLPTRGLELIRLLRLHIEGESRIMRQFPSIAA
jgi:hemerythrin-like domain-containing protein